MASTTFVNGVTLSDGTGWANDVDYETYDGATTQVLVGGGAGVLAVWTTATGTGAPVRAGTPTFTSNITFSAASAKLIPGATNFSLRNNADNADNVLVTDAGAVTIRAGATITAGGLTVTAGNIVVSAGTFSCSGVGTLTGGGAIGGAITTVQSGVTARSTVLTSTATENPLTVVHSGGSGAFGLGIGYTGSAPNGAGNSFVWCQDNTAGGTQRAAIYSNGGIANFQANDVNLSTRAVKNGYRVYSDTELLKYESFLEAVDFGIWKYNDQTHDDWNHGPTVEGVQSALRGCELADEECSLIGEFAEGKMGLYTHDFTNIALASLVASNKRSRESLSDLLAWKAKAEVAMDANGITVK